MRPSLEVRGEKRRGVRSEYGGLILSADSALGFLGVYEPRGAALRIPLLLHDVPLQTQMEGIKLVASRSTPVAVFTCRVMSPTLYDTSLLHKKKIFLTVDVQIFHSPFQTFWTSTEWDFSVNVKITCVTAKPSLGGA